MCCTGRRTNPRHALLINRDGDSRWRLSKPSPFDRTYSTVAIDKWLAEAADSRRARKRRLEEKWIGRWETRLTTRSPLAWRLAHSERLVPPLARNLRGPAFAEACFLRGASPRSRYRGSGACNGERWPRGRGRSRETRRIRSELSAPCFNPEWSRGYQLKYFYTLLFPNARCLVRPQIILFNIFYISRNKTCNTRYYDAIASSLVASELIRVAENTRFEVVEWYLGVAADEGSGFQGETASRALTA